MGDQFQALWMLDIGLQLRDTGLDIHDMALALRVALIQRGDLLAEPLLALSELSQPPFALMQLGLQAGTAHRNRLSLSLSGLEQFPMLGQFLLVWAECAACGAGTGRAGHALLQGPAKSLEFRSRHGIHAGHELVDK